MKEERSRLYSYAIVAQKVHAHSKYQWERVGKYKKLKDAENALWNFRGGIVDELIYKIIPYFDGYWWTDVEIQKKQYMETNSLLWDFLSQKNLVDDARDFIYKHRKTQTQ